MRFAIFDRLANLVTGLAGPKDKTAALQHIQVIRTKAELDAAYRDNWIAKKAIDIVPFDMLREWRSWQADDKIVEKIEAAENALGLRTKLMAGMIRGRLYGGGAIIVGDGSSDPSQELVIEQLPKGGIKYLHVVSRHEITAAEPILQLGSPYFGQPSYYRLKNARTYQSATDNIHPSRVIRFLGAPIPEDGTSGAEGCWSDSILQAILDAVDQATSAAQHVAAMIPEAKQDIVSIPNLSQWLSTADGTAKLTERLAYAQQMKSMFGMLVLEGDGSSPEGELYQQKQLSFASIPEVVRLFLQIASGAADIPITRMLGQSPAGLSSTGEGDLQNYYDHVASKQKVELTPTIRPLDRLLLRHALGGEPRGVWYSWNSLYQPTEKEKAEVGDIKSRTALNLKRSGLVPNDVLAEGVKGFLINSDLMPGIENAYDEHGDVIVDPESLSIGSGGNVVRLPTAFADAASAAGMAVGDRVEFESDKQTEKGPSAGTVVAVGNGMVTISHSDTLGETFDVSALQVRRRSRSADGAVLWMLDAEPRSLYVHRKVLNSREIIAWAKSQGFTSTLPANDLHVTICFSREPIDWMKVEQDWSSESTGKVSVQPGGPRMVDQFGDATVLLFNSWKLSSRHGDFIEAGASWDHDDYQPHITLTYTAKDMDLDKVVPFNGAIELGPEVFALVKEDWSQDLKEIET